LVKYDCEGTIGSSLTFESNIPTAGAKSSKDGTPDGGKQMTTSISGPGSASESHAAPHNPARQLRTLRPPAPVPIRGKAMDNLYRDFLLGALIVRFSSRMHSPATASIICLSGTISVPSRRPPFEKPSGPLVARQAMQRFRRRQRVQPLGMFSLS